MKLSDAGQARVRGYLFILHRSLASFMPGEMARESLREVESHILERVARVEDGADEKRTLEQILEQLGPPLKVAQAWAAEITFDEAVATGRISPILRALGYAAMSVQGFFASLALFVGYVAGFSFVAMALLKPIFPNNVGVHLRDGIPVAFGAIFPVPPGTEVIGGYVLIPIFLFVGALVLAGTHLAARKFVAWWRGRLRGPVPE